MVQALFTEKTELRMMESENNFFEEKVDIL